MDNVRCSSDDDRIQDCYYVDETEENCETNEGAGVICHAHGINLLYSAGGYSYYSVAVAEGVTLVEGAVAQTCSEAGLEAVCSGPTDCRWTDTNYCLVTPLSDDCHNPLGPIAGAICDQSRMSENNTTGTATGTGAGQGESGRQRSQQCEETEGLFSYMNDWAGGSDCGNVEGIWCADGSNYVAGQNGAEYFAYCALQL